MKLTMTTDAPLSYTVPPRVNGPIIPVKESVR